MKISYLSKYLQVSAIFLSVTGCGLGAPFSQYGPDIARIDTTAIAVDPAGRVHFYLTEPAQSRIRHLSFEEDKGFSTFDNIPVSTQFYYTSAVAVSDESGDLFYAPSAGVSLQKIANETNWSVKAPTDASHRDPSTGGEYVISSQEKLEIRRYEGMENDEYRLNTRRFDNGEKTTYPSISFADIIGVRAIRPLMRNGIWKQELLGIFYDNSQIIEFTHDHTKEDTTSKNFTARLKLIKLETDRWTTSTIAEIELPYHYIHLGYTSLTQIGGKLTTTIDLYYAINYNENTTTYEASKIKYGDDYINIIKTRMGMNQIFIDDKNRLHGVRQEYIESSRSFQDVYEIFDGEVSKRDPVTRLTIPN